MTAQRVGISVYIRNLVTMATRVLAKPQGIGRCFANVREKSARQDSSIFSLFFSIFFWNLYELQIWRSEITWEGGGGGGTLLPSLSLASALATDVILHLIMMTRNTECACLLYLWIIIIINLCIVFILNTKTLTLLLHLLPVLKSLWTENSFDMPDYYY